MAEQNFSNHVRFFPPFHFFVVPVLLINFFWSSYRWKTSGFSVDGFEYVVVAAALLIGFLSVRMMALSVQDRVIRLEERLRTSAWCRGLEAAHRGVHREPVRFVALCQRCGTSGARAKSARRKAKPAQSHQAACEELETGLPARVIFQR